MAWAAILGGALATLGFAFMPDYLFLTHPYVENPFGIAGVIGGGLTTYELFGASRFLGMRLLLASTLAAHISLILWLRHTSGNERQQIKWFLFAAVPLAVFLGLIELDLLIGNLTYDFMFRKVWLFPTWQAHSTVQFVTVFALLLIPVFTYIAILKYRLYEDQEHSQKGRSTHPRSVGRSHSLSDLGAHARRRCGMVRPLRLLPTGSILMNTAVGLKFRLRVFRGVYSRW